MKQEEIGDIDAINYAVCSGVKGIFSAHSKNFECMKLNIELKRLLDMKLMERIIFLDCKVKGKIESVYILNSENSKTNYNYEKIL